MAICQKAIEVSRHNFRPGKWCFKAYNRMGSVAEKQKDFPKAIDYYKKALVEQKTN